MLAENESYSIISDHLGTPLKMIDSTGKTTWSETFDLWGKEHLEAKTVQGRGYSITKSEVRTWKETEELPFRFQGQIYDPETKMCYNRYRYYMADEGIYTQRDPIGLAGGNPTLYGYVYNTLTQIDPWGLRIPYGFKSFGQFNQFGQALQAGLSNAGFHNAISFMQGSSVSGFSFNTGTAFDVGRVSDFDVAISQSDLFERAKSLGLTKGGRTEPISMGSSQAKALDIDDTLQRLAKKSGREVNAMIFENVTEIKAKSSNNIRIPGKKY